MANLLPPGFTGGPNVSGPTGTSIGNQIVALANKSTPSPAAPPSTPTPTPSYASSAPVDPYASFGGTAAYNRLVAGFNSQDQAIKSQEADSAANAGIGLHSNILDLVDQLTQGQNKVNNEAVQADLAKQQGTQGVLQMIQHGLQSGGVQLANKNASNSSAVGALARAYQDIGRRAQTQVGTQFAQAENTINTDQQAQDIQKAEGSRHIQETKAQTINNIVSDAANKLQALNAAMTYANMPARIQIEQEKQAIRDQATNALAQYDGQLSSSVNPIVASSDEARRAAAAHLATEGTAADNAFNYQQAGPAQFQGTGPAASNIPLFTLPRSKTTA